MKFQSSIFFLSLGLSMLLVSSCKKEDDQLPPAEQLALDITIIETYLATNNLQAEKTASGLHYIIKEEGTGEHPLPTSRVTVKYKGYFVDGTVFDQTPPANTLTFGLNEVIPGWTEGIPLLKSGGGKGMLLIPSALGYGRPGRGSIPPNKVLLFDVTLLDFE
ncbi:MAG: FKBP-type peptidyl-prolyl cis-trans isomerase [Saprospiraceae bacterium]|nr:FKBP-type peptidyl-prolyl cis-trans isomerase [Saprospiraceae bacterium]